MVKQGTSVNTSRGGHLKATVFRQIVADPNGNREQRRAAAKLAKKEYGEAGDAR